MKIGPKVLIFDIETSLTIFGAYPQKKPQYLGHDNILQEWFMICAAWQWEGSKKIHSVSALDNMSNFKKDPFDDYHVVKALAKVVSEADAIVGHNMRRFDWPKLLARMAYHKLPAIDIPKIVDTFVMAKQMQFSYNSLAYLAKHLDVEAQKLSHSKDMWLRIIRGDKSAIKEALIYNRADVKATMALYLRLKPYVPTRLLPNENLYRGNGVECCPSCGCTEFKANGTRATLTGLYQRYRCLNAHCNKYFSGTKMIKRVRLK